MARKGLVMNNLLREKLCKRDSQKRQELKNMIKKEQDIDKKLLLIQKLHNLNRNGSPVRYRNRCAETGRSRGYDGITGFCRTIARLRMCEGALAGFKKGRVRG